MEDDNEEYGITVVQTLEEFDPTTVTARSPKRYITAGLKGGFDVRVATTRTVQARAPFISGENAGEARPNIEVTHLWVIAIAPNAAWFRLHFEDNRFKEAKVWDTAGWPTELYFDYAPSAETLRRHKDEPEVPWKRRVEQIKENIDRLDRTCNDGEFWLNKNPRLVGSAAALDDWLADFVPGFTARKKKKPEATPVVDIIKEGEWRE